MRSRVWVWVLLAVAAVGFSFWLASPPGLTARIVLAGTVAAVTAAFAQPFVDWTIRRARVRRLAARVPELDPTSTAAGLLRPEQRVVPFIGRDDEYAELREWCRDRKPPVRLLVGAGGVGKTRLAVELSHHFKSAGWSVAVVAAGQEAEALVRLRATTRGPILLVVDYAETRTELGELLRSVARDPANVRVLLIARVVGDWWRQLRSDDASVRQLVTAYPPMTLCAEVNAPASQARLVREAIPHFARRLGVPVPTGVEVNVPREVPLLVLHAAALVAVLRSAPAGTPGMRLVADHDVFGELLGHESRYWSHQGGPPVSLKVRQQAVAVACLFPARNETDAAALLRRVPDLADDDPRRRELARWLTVLYPAGSQHDYWGTLQPELVGEQHVIEQAQDCPDLLLTELATLRAEQLRQMLTVLSRATEHRPAEQGLLAAVLCADLPRLWRPALTVAMASGGGLRTVFFRLMATSELEPGLLREIEQAIPYPTTQLARTAVVLARRRLNSLAPDSDPADIARRLERLAVMEAQAGRSKAAWRHLDRAIEHHRELSASAGQGYLPSLARCLHLRAIRQAELGELDLARADAAEAVQKFVELTDSTGYQADLAACRHNLGCWMIDQDPAAAASMLTEAVRSYRTLVEHDRDQYLGALHEAQANLRRCQPPPPKVDPRHHPEPSEVSLKARESEVEHYRKLAESAPDQYNPDLAHALHTLGGAQETEEQYQQAYSTLAEAVRLYRPLHQANRDRYRPDLAAVLNDLGVVLTELGRFTDAEEPAAEAAERYRELMKAHSQRYRPELARSLDNLVALRVRAGRHVDALDPAEESVTLYRELHELDKPDEGRYRSELARALTNHSVCLTELRRHAEALSIAEEAVRHYRDMHGAGRPEERPRYASRLAHALDNVAVDFVALRRYPEADRCRTEATALRATSPTATETQLAGTSL